MPEDPKWEMERPLALTPEAALLRQVLRFVFGNLHWLAGGVILGAYLGWLAQNYLPATYEAEGRFVVNEVPFLQKSAQNNNPPNHEAENDLVQSVILGIPSLNMRNVTAAHLGIAQGRICFEDISSRPLPLKGDEPVANIRVASVRNSRTGTISVKSQSAAFAARVANTLLDELGNYNLAQGHVNALDLAAQFTMAQAESSRPLLAQQEQARIWAEQQVAQLDEYEKQNLPLESFPQFVGDTTLNNLKTERLLNQADLAGLATTSSGGLQLENKKAQVADIGEEIKRQALALAAGQRSQLAVARVQEQNLQAQLRDARQKIDQYSREREEWVQSFGDIALMEKLIANATNGQPQRGSAILMVNRAMPAERASSPKLWLNLAVGIFVCGLAGLLVAVTCRLLDDRLFSPKDVAVLTRIPCVATIPRRSIFSWINRVVLRRSPARKGFNPLRGRLLLSPPGAKTQILGFTPARKWESASHAVADIALMLARAGHRTLVVDLHYSKPRQARLLRIKPRMGLQSWMASTDGIEKFISSAKLPELGLLACVRRKKPSGDLIARRPLASILPQLEPAWEFILIDAPAISDCWDLMLALPAESELVITARRRQTHARQVVQTALVARNQNWNVAGVALQDC